MNVPCHFKASAARHRICNSSPAVQGARGVDGGLLGLRLVEALLPSVTETSRFWSLFWLFSQSCRWSLRPGWYIMTRKPTTRCQRHLPKWWQGGAHFFLERPVREWDHERRCRCNLSRSLWADQCERVRSPNRRSKRLFGKISRKRRGAFPDINEKLFLRDHYLNKTVVDPIRGALPTLIGTYGEVQEFQFYLLEFQTIEDEQRQVAVGEGVIYDLVSHLIALAQLYFLISPFPACYLRKGMPVRKVELRINHVARARYHHCDLDDGVETFAAVDVTVLIGYPKNRTHNIRGLLVGAKGVKPIESVEADLKGMRYKFGPETRAANLAQGTINPPLADLAFIPPAESGFFGPIVESLSYARPSGGLTGAAPQRQHRLMNFAEGRQNARYLCDAIHMGRSNLTFYSPQRETLREVLARCVSHCNLDPKWLPQSEFTDIGFSR